MNNNRRQARVNIKAIAILLGAVIRVGVSLVTARYAVQRIRSSRALATGEFAYDSGDWDTAFSQYAGYVRRNPDDSEIL